MAHFAELDENNKVIRVIVVGNEFILDENGNESEQVGINFCKSLLGENTKWIQTSYNNNFRRKYASMNYTYDENEDIFIEPQPFSNWSFNDETLEWEPPIPKPNNNSDYIWDEELQDWLILS